MTYFGVTTMILAATAYAIATGGVGAPALAAAIVAAGTMVAGAGLTVMRANEVAYGVTGCNKRISSINARSKCCHIKYYKSQL